MVSPNEIRAPRAVPPSVARVSLRVGLAALALPALLAPPALAQTLRGAAPPTSSVTYEDDVRPQPQVAPTRVDDSIFDTAASILPRDGALTTNSADPATPGATPGATEVTGAIDPRTGRPRPRTPAKPRAKAGPITSVAPLAASGAVDGAGSVAPRAALTPDPRDARAREREEAEKEDDAFAPLGLRMGGMTWFPTLELSGGRTSNVDGRVGGRPSAAWTIAPEISGKSDWSRHALELRLRGAYTGYPTEPLQDRPRFGADLRGRVDLSDLTRLEIAAGWSRERQSQSTSETTVGSLAPDQESATASLGLGRDVGALALTLRGDMERTDYFARSAVTAGSNGPDVQNNTRWIGALRVGVGGEPALRPFVEVRASTRRYDMPVISGQRRDTDGAAAVVGVVADAGPLLRGEISTGWGFEKPVGGDLPTMSGWLLDGKLVWSPTRLTVVRVEAETGFLPTTLSGSPGAITRSANLTVEQALRRDLTASIGGGIQTKSYVGLGISESSLLLAGALTYKVDRSIQTFVKADWSRNLASNSASYDVGTIMTGLRLQH